MQRPNRFSHKMLYEIPCHTRYSKYSHHCKEIPVHYSFFPLWLSAWLFKASTRGNKDLASSSPNQYTNSLESHTFKKKISSVYVEEKKVCSLWNKCGPLYGSQMPNALQFCDRIVSCKAVKVVIGTINVRLIQVH